MVALVCLNEGLPILKNVSMNNYADLTKVLGRGRSTVSAFTATGAFVVLRHVKFREIPVEFLQTEEVNLHLILEPTMVKLGDRFAETVDAKNLYRMLGNPSDIFAEWFRHGVAHLRLKENVDYVRNNHGRIRLSLEAAASLAILKPLNYRKPVADFLADCAKIAAPMVIPTPVTDERTMAERIQALEHRMDREAPKIRFYEMLNGAAGDLTIGLAAKRLGVGEIRLFRWMRKHGFLCAQRGPEFNLPFQSYVSSGSMRVVTRTRQNPKTKELVPYSVALLTPRGFLRLQRLLAQLPPDEFNALK